MATSVSLNGVTYSIPAVNDEGWGNNVSNYLIAIAQATLQKSGGSFTLTAEVNFGATYGIKAAYLKSQATNPASAGIIRLGNAEGIAWRNAANGADKTFKLDASDKWSFGAVAVSETELDYLVGVTSDIQTQLDAKASTTSLSDHINDTTDAHAASAITNTPSGNLAATTVQNALNELQTDIDTRATSASPSFTTDAKLTNQAIAKFYEQTDNGTNYIGLSAPDAVTADATFKLPDGDGSANQVLKTDGSKNLGWASVATTVTTTRGDIITRGASADQRLAIGSAGKYLKSDGTDPSWQTLQASDLSDYATGTWTPAESSKTNITGTASFGTAKYQKIGNMVFAQLNEITGLSVTNTTTETIYVMTTTGLPNYANATRAMGTARTTTAGGNRTVVASITENSGSDSLLYLSFASNGTGALTLADIVIQYFIT